MSILESIILGLIQGLTEFLPVSSSGHLIIGQTILGLDISAEDSLSFSVVVHTATVISTLVILWGEIKHLFIGTFTTTKWNDDKEYVCKILLSMIPVFIVGMFFKDTIEDIFGEGLNVVSICLIVTSLLLAFAYFAKPREKENISYFHAFIIGLAQAIAVLPGLSPSGTTIATGLLLGNKKEKVAQFSFLMVIIPILGEAFLDLLKMLKDSSAFTNIETLPLLFGFIAAFLSGCFACKFMINIVKRGKLIYFAIYCFVVGCGSLIYNYIYL